MKVRQVSQVTIRGSVLEKRTGRLFEAFFISIFLLSLFLTGCSPAMHSNPASQGANPILQATGEATMPPSTDGAENGAGNVLGNVSGESQASSAKDAEAKPSGATKSMLLAFVSEDAVVERVRLVSGWLSFSRQVKAAELVEAGWDRVSSGQVIEPLNNAAVADRPELSKTELMLWRQILVTAFAPPQSLETLAVMLTVSTTPDDLLQVDNLLRVSTAASEY